MLEIELCLHLNWMIWPQSMFLYTMRQSVFSLRFSRSFSRVVLMSLRIPSWSTRVPILPLISPLSPSLSERIFLIDYMVERFWRWAVFSRSINNFFILSFCFSKSKLVLWCLISVSIDIISLLNFNISSFRSQFWLWTIYTLSLRTENMLVDSWEQACGGFISNDSNELLESTMLYVTPSTSTCLSSSLLEFQSISE